MNDSVYDEDGQFTDKYKIQIMVHPVIHGLFSLISQSKKDKADCDQRDVYDKFFSVLEVSSNTFHSLGAKAFDEAEIVQNGLNLTNDFLYQEFPSISDFQSREQNYERINKLFWGKYFYLNGVDGANRASDTHIISPWEAAKHFANDFWRSESDAFPETIWLGCIFLLENDPANKVDLSKVTNLLGRFGFDEDVQLGFLYFLGLTAYTAKSGESLEDLRKRIWRFPSVDINSEFEGLLGPLHVFLIHSTLDELVWRFNGDFEVRGVIVSDPEKPISEYNFKNYKLIYEDDRRIQHLKDAEDIFSQAMKKIGIEFVEKSYSRDGVFKAGICAANVRAQHDIKTTHNISAHFDKFLPLIFAAANRFLIQEDLSWDEHLNIQIPLQQFLGGLPHELGHAIWSYQSFLLFKGGAAKAGLEELDTQDFMDQCRLTALEFLQKNPQYCREVALKDLHWTAVPHLRNGYDEKAVILDAINDRFGHDGQSPTYADKATLKALIIFSYFCSLCQTITFFDHPEKIN